MMTIADGEEMVLKPLILAVVICEQLLIRNIQVPRHLLLLC